MGQTMHDDDTHAVPEPRLVGPFVVRPRFMAGCILAGLATVWILPQLSWAITHAGAALGAAGALALAATPQLGGVRHIGRERRANWSAVLHISGVTLLGISAAMAASPETAWVSYTTTATFAGGTLAVIRSTRTNAVAEESNVRMEDQGRTLTEVRDALQQTRQHLLELERRNEEEAGLLALAEVAYRSERVAEIEDALDRMLAKAILLPENSSGIDAMSLWIRLEHAWVIRSGTGINEDTLTHFRQDVITEERPGAGVLANMAATGRTLFLWPRRVAEHPWFRPNAHSQGVVQGMAAVLLRNRDGHVIGGLCLTSSDEGAIPDRGDPRRADFEATLSLWSVAFTLAVVRYVDTLLKEA